MSKIKYVPPMNKSFTEPVYKEEPVLPAINWQRMFNKIFKRRGGKNGKK